MPRNHHFNKDVTDTSALKLQYGKLYKDGHLSLVQSNPYQLRLFAKMKLSNLSLLSIATFVTAADNPYSNYPSVAKTATINGFADKVYDAYPQCAKECLKQSTANTPCPYWDIGCLCVMSQWNSPVAQCIANNCAGSDVSSASNVAVNSCSAAGVWLPYWIINDAASSALNSAAQKQVAASTTSEASSSVSSSAAVPASTSAAPNTASSTSAAPSSPVSTPSETQVTSKSLVSSEAKKSAVSSSPLTLATLASSGAGSSSTKRSSSQSVPISSFSWSKSLTGSSVTVTLSKNCTSCSGTSPVGPSIIASANGVAQVGPVLIAGALAAIAALV